MKTISFMLALIISSMAFMPCSDGEPCTIGKSCSNDMKDINAESEHDHDHEEEDECTPFCTCACCGTSVTFQISEIDSTPLLAIFFSYKVLYTFNYSYDHIDGVWHPPTVS